MPAATARWDCSAMDESCWAHQVAAVPVDVVVPLGLELEPAVACAGHTLPIRCCSTPAVPSIMQRRQASAAARHAHARAISLSGCVVLCNNNAAHLSCGCGCRRSSTLRWGRLQSGGVRLALAQPGQALALAPRTQHAQPAAPLGAPARAALALWPTAARWIVG